MRKPALLVIDVQKVYTSKESELYCRDSKSTVKRINSLIELFKSKSLQVIYIRHIHRADGSDLGRMFDYLGEPEEDFNFKEGSTEIEYDSDLVVLSKPTEIIKNRYSAFVGTQLESLLHRNGIDTVVICGFMTNFCCDSTARDAHDRDFFVDFVVDATGTPGTEGLDEKQIRQSVKELLSAGYARVCTTAKFLTNAGK